MTDATALAARVTELETLYMQLERTIDDLGAVLLAQQRTLEALAARISAIERLATHESAEPHEP